MFGRMTLASAMLALLIMYALPPLAGARAEDGAVEEDDGWVSLIPEDNLDGWRPGKEGNDKYWRLDDGAIVGENPDRAGSILWTQTNYTDFELEVAYRTPSQDYDSGVFLRGASHQAQIGVSRSLKKDLTGCLYCPRDGNGAYPIQPDETVREHHRLGAWNTLRIVVRGKRIQTFLNGEPINDYEGKTIPARGPIGLQLHSGVHMEMQFRVVRVRGLEADAG